MESVDAPDVWKNITRKINDESGKTRSVDQVRKNFYKMRDCYKMAKDNNRQTGRGMHTCEYFEVFDRVIGQKPSVSMKTIREVGASQFMNDDYTIPKPTVISTTDKEERMIDQQDAAVISKQWSSKANRKRKRVSGASVASTLAETVKSMQADNSRQFGEFLEAWKESEARSNAQFADSLKVISQLLKKD
jgi:hypothetical protein